MAGDVTTMADAVARIQLNVFKLQIVNLEAAPDTEYCMLVLGEL